MPLAVLANDLRPRLRFLLRSHGRRSYGLPADRPKSDANQVLGVWRRIDAHAWSAVGASMTIVLIVIVAIVVIAVLYYIAKRNSIIASRNRVDESWSGIDVQLKRRHDLVPNLVETVKGYAAHESQVFEKIDPGARRGDVRPGRRRHRQSRAETDRGADRPARRRRELPAAARHRELPAAEPQPLRAGGRDPGLAPDLQLQRAVLQHHDPAVPGLDHRQPERLHRRASTSRSRTPPTASRSRSASADG